jgi:Ser/Thr protein kinase RdoA (MazF antagonist)
MSLEAPYAELSPETVLDALEVLDFRCDGRVLALNSYENRVYQIGIEDGEPVVAKFYRPGRWSDAAIAEEHAFAAELAAQEIPVVAPLAPHGETLHFHRGFRYAVFPRRGGRWPELGRADEREWVGRFLGRIHAVGRSAPFRERTRLSVEELGRRARDFVLEGEWLPDYLADKYADLTDELLEEVEAQALGWRGARLGRILGDCHRGNILWTDLGPHFVDLDDCVTGPAIQDLWMLLAGTRQEMRTQLTDLLKGYEQFLPFDRSELALIEPLRALRMIHYSAWLARRWYDPAFPKAFPWFAEPRYWEEHYRALEEQLAAVRAEPLEL